MEMKERWIWNTILVKINPVYLLLYNIMLELYNVLKQKQIT